MENQISVPRRSDRIFWKQFWKDLDEILKIPEYASLINDESQVQDNDESQVQDIDFDSIFENINSQNEDDGLPDLTF